MSPRHRMIWLAGALALCAVALVFVLLRPSERCGADRRLDQLLKGGRPVCLGGSFAPLTRATGRGQLLLDNSGGGYFTLSEQGRTYTYVATGNAFWSSSARWARIRSACVKGLRDSTASARLATEIRSGLKSRWDQETLTTRRGRSAWRTRDDRLRLYASSTGEVCLLQLRSR